MRRRAIAAMVGVVATVGVFAGLVSGSASAAPAWLPPSVLSPSGAGAVGNAALAADAKGEAVSVWWREGVGIEGAFRPAESPNWAASASVSTPGQHAENPQVGIDAQGDAVAVWQGGPEEKVEAAVRLASSGLWQAHVAISPEGGGWLRPQVAVDARGDAVAMWSYPYPEGSPSAVVNDTIQAAEKPAGGSGWEPAVWVSPFGKAPYEQRFSKAPQVAIDAEGGAVAVWEDQASESASVTHNLIEAAVKPPNSTTWGSPVVLAEAGRQPQVAMDASGDAVAVWPGPGGLYSATLPASSSIWQPPISVSATEAENPHIAIDSLGDAVVAWESIGAATNTVQAAVKAKGDAAWAAPASLSEPVEYAGGYPRLNPSVAIDAKGSAAATWNGIRSQTDETVQVAVLPAIGSSWQAPVQLADVSDSFVIPVVGMDEKGNGEAVWAHGSGASAAVEAANYDGSSPALEGASIPTTGQTARPLAFAVSPLAVTTALGQTSWSFGDGSQPTVGTSVSHAFTAPGSYHVTVTTADVLGNTTSASSTVVVTNASTRPRCRCMRQHLILSKVHITNRRFRVTGSHASRKGQHRPVLPFGTTFRFALSERATVRIEIARVGVRDCKKATSHCTHRPAGTLMYVAERAGSDAAVFHGRVGKNVLRAGRYIASITAHSRFGSSKTVQVPFVVAPIARRGA
jgi:PKD repeat protein